MRFLGNWDGGVNFGRRFGLLSSALYVFFHFSVINDGVQVIIIVDDWLQEKLERFFPGHGGL